MCVACVEYVSSVLAALNIFLCGIWMMLFSRKTDDMKRQLNVCLKLLEVGQLVGLELYENNKQ